MENKKRKLSTVRFYNLVEGKALVDFIENIWGEDQSLWDWSHIASVLNVHGIWGKWIARDRVWQTRVSRAIAFESNATSEGILLRVEMKLALLRYMEKDGISQTKLAESLLLTRTDLSDLFNGYIMWTEAQVERAMSVVGFGYWRTAIGVGPESALLYKNYSESKNKAKEWRNIWGDLPQPQPQMSLASQPQKAINKETFAIMDQVPLPGKIVVGVEAPAARVEITKPLDSGPKVFGRQMKLTKSMKVQEYVCDHLLWLYETKRLLSADALDRMGRMLWDHDPFEADRK